MRILLSRTDRVGDLILSTPAIASVRRSFPSAHITLACSRYNAVVVDRSPDIDSVVQWTPDLIFALAWLVFVLSFGAIWLLYFLIRRAAATRVVALFYLTPPVTALMAWGLFNERLAPLALAGMAVCVVSVALVNGRPAAA